MSTMTESDCQAVGWKNVVDGQYAIEVPGVVVGTGAWVRGCYNSNMWLKYYNKMTDDDKNMLPLADKLDELLME